MKSGFTLIELLITLAIISMVTVLGVPAFSKYGERARFDQKVSEIKYGLEETHLAMLNPENGVQVYSLGASASSTIVSMKSGAPGAMVEYKKILLSSKDSILADGFISCVVTAKKCTINGVADVFSGELFRLHNSGDNRTVTFSIKDDPFGVVTVETP